MPFRKRHRNRSEGFQAEQPCHQRFAAQTAFNNTNKSKRLLMYARRQQHAYIAKLSLCLICFKSSDYFPNFHRSICWTESAAEFIPWNTNCYIRVSDGDKEGSREILRNAVYSLFDDMFRLFCVNTFDTGSGSFGPKRYPIRQGQLVCLAICLSVSK